MSNNLALAGEGAVWIQPYGPNTQPMYLGCHELGDISAPKGDVKTYYCKDPSKPNAWVVTGSSQAAPGPVTTSIATDILKTQDWLEKVKCPTTLFVHRVSCGRMNVFSGYDRSFLLKGVRITQRQLTKLTAANPDSQDRTLQSYELSADEMIDIFKLVATRLATTETENFNSITSCDADSCAGNCGSASDAGDTFYTATGLLAGSPLNQADVYKWTDGGGSVAQFAQRAFAGGEDIGSIVCFQMDATTQRVLVSRATTDAGNPAEVAYTDDGGATWTLANVGSTNAQFTLGPKSLFALDRYNIWMVVQDGYVYKSVDGGATWTAQTTGAATIQDLNAIHFSDQENGFAVGVANAIIKTTDGGVIWSVVTGPVAMAANEINAVYVHDAYKAWIGYATGEVYYTIDGGATWSLRSIGAPSGGVVSDMDWYDEMFGIIAHQAASTVGTLYVTIDGGFSWETISTPTNAGINAVKVINPLLAYAVGPIYGGTGLVLKITGG